MNAFARLVYVVERGKKTIIALRAQEAQEKRRQLAQQTSLTGSAQVPLPAMANLHIMRKAPAHMLICSQGHGTLPKITVEAYR